MSSQSFQVTLPLKSTGVAYLWWLFFGGIGAHKFYLGRPLIGFIYMCTLGLLFIGTFIDLFTLPSQVRKANRKLVAEANDLLAMQNTNRSLGSPSPIQQIGLLKD